MLRKLLPASLLAVAIAASGSTPAFGHDDGKSTAPAVYAQMMAAVPCTNGMANIYPCKNVDLLAWMPLNTIGGGNGK